MLVLPYPEEATPFSLIKPYEALACGGPSGGVGGLGGFGGLGGLGGFIILTLCFCSSIFSFVAIRLIGKMV